MVVSFKRKYVVCETMVKNDIGKKLINCEQSETKTRQITSTMSIYKLDLYNVAVSYFDLYFEFLTNIALMIIVVQSDLFLYD